MILVDQNMGLEYKLSCQCLNAIIIEEPRCYELFIKKLHEQINKVEEQLLLYNEQNDLQDMSKKCMLFFSPLDLSYQNARFQKKFLSYLVDEIETCDKRDALNQNHAELICIMDEIRDILEYHITFEDQYSTVNILKGLNVSLENPIGNFTEKFMECATVYRDFLGTNIFFLVGCSGFISEEEFVFLQEWARYQEMVCVFIEYSDCRVPNVVKK